MKKRITIFTLSLCVLLFAVFIIFHSFVLPKPGTLVDPKSLPKADRSDVGATVAVSFDALLAQQPGDNKTIVFAYVYNGTDQSGRLAVYTHYEHEQPVAMLTVYEPEWTGFDGVLTAMENGFQAKIMDRSIVSAEEYRRLSMASYRVSDKTNLKEGEILSPSDGISPAGDERIYYFGHISNHSDDPLCNETQTGNYWVIVGNTENSAGDSVATAIKNLKLTAERFKLEASLGI